MNSAIYSEKSLYVEERRVLKVVHWSIGLKDTKYKREDSSTDSQTTGCY
jgi:hypothetical protein